MSSRRRSTPLTCSPVCIIDRAVKTPYEIECLRRASRLGASGHRAAEAAFREGASEYEIHMRYLAACVQREEEMPYNNIVALNEHCAVLHYQHLERQAPSPLRSMLIDAGAQYRGYAADITRTYAAAPGRFADLVGAMDRAQLELCDLIVAGRDYRDVHLAAHEVLGDVMHQAGILRVPGAEALTQGLTRVFFPHGIGHLLGLQVHDVGGVLEDLKGGERPRPEGHPYLRLTRMLEPGVVVTVEPGIYFIESLLRAARADERKSSLIDWQVVEELKPYGGIRIEDDVVATAGKPLESHAGGVRLAGSLTVPGAAALEAAYQAAAFLRRLGASASAPDAVSSASSFFLDLRGALPDLGSSAWVATTAAESTSCISAMSAESPGRGSILRMRV